jgi:hypothetical protein
MKKSWTFLNFIILSTTLFAQQDIGRISDSLFEEGSRLYKSEMASWYGTDVFLEQYKDRQNVGGYFSYCDDNIAKCVFFSKNDTPKVIGTISFDTSYNVNTAQVDLSERDFTTNEIVLYSIRREAFNAVNNDTLFKAYKNTSLNLIPIISNGQKKVYVLTGPKENGVVIFGNDYLLTFDNNNKLIGKKELHKNIISINYGNTGDTTVVGTMHTHLPETGDFITPTDICTLMLYARFAKWQQHYVISKNYISIWDCNKNLLAILTKKAWDNINNDQKKRNKNK